jgi:long-chain fatty acid transport protein
MRYLSLLLSVAAVLAYSGVAAASGFQTFESDAAHTGQATAGMTMTENASVVAELPAAMVRMEGKGGSLVGATQYDPKYHANVAVPGLSSETTTGKVVAPHAYFVHNAKSWAWGAGLYYPYNVVVEWPSNWYLNTAVIKDEIRTQYLAFSGAYAANDQFSLGGSLIYIDLRAKLTSDANPSPAAVSPSTVDVKGTKVGYNVSGMWTADQIAVGLNHNFGYEISADGTAGNGALPATATFKIPSTTALGVSFRSKATDPDWLVEFDALRTTWSDFKDIKVSTALGVQTIKKNWKDVVGYKVGGNYVVARSGNASHRVRAGIYLDNSPIPDDTLAPDVPDGKGRTEWAVGYGFKTGGLIVDASYFNVKFKDADTGPANPITTNLGGKPTTFGGDVKIIAVSVGYSY